MHGDKFKMHNESYGAPGEAGRLWPPHTSAKLIIEGKPLIW